MSISSFLHTLLDINKICATLTTLICLIFISINNKNKYFSLFNFQHILLSLGTSQNVILRIFKNI